jgi:hypothetical protein
VEVAPVASQSQDQEQKCDHQESCRLRRVDRVSVMLVIVLQSGAGHANIVALWDCESSLAQDP